MRGTSDVANNQHQLGIAIASYSTDERSLLPKFLARGDPSTGALGYTTHEWFRLYKGYILPGPLGTTLDDERNAYALGAAAPVRLPQHHQQRGILRPSNTLFVGTRPKVFDYVFNTFNNNSPLGIATTISKLDDVPRGKILLIDHYMNGPWFTTVVPSMAAEFNGLPWSMFLTPAVRAAIRRASTTAAVPTSFSPGGTCSTRGPKLISPTTRLACGTRW